jgi:protein-tyrosine phosphatase
LIDIHCHLLPGMDDGATGWDEALAMADIAAQDGIRAIIATPHQLGSYVGNRGETIRARVAQLQPMLDKRQTQVTVLAGADVRVETDLARRIRSGDVLTLADQRRHVLLELPHEVYLPLEGVLAELGRTGLVAILSHPERNLGILRQPDVLGPLVRAGCLVQITAASLTGGFGSRVQTFAESLVRRGLVHFVATDAHSTRSRAPRLSAAFHRVAALAGRKAAITLCCENPARVMAGDDVSVRPRRIAKPAWTTWLRWKKAG